jgi:hypothetical protein
MGGAKPWKLELVCRETEPSGWDGVREVVEVPDRADFRLVLLDKPMRPASK